MVNSNFRNAMSWQMAQGLLKLIFLFLFGPTSSHIIESKEVNFIPYRSIRPVYTIPTSALVQIPPLFCTGKNTSHTGEIRLFRPVNGYQVKIEKSQRKILTNF